MTKNKRSVLGKAGITFFEVMVAIVILSTGIVMVYKSFLKSLDYQSYLTARSCAVNLLEHKIAVIKAEYQENGGVNLVEGIEAYDVVLNNRPVTFQFDIRYSAVDAVNDISQLDLMLSWMERGRSFYLSRSMYVSEF